MRFETFDKHVFFYDFVDEIYKASMFMKNI